jgi:hypothetical protein
MSHLIVRALPKTAAQPLPCPFCGHPADAGRIGFTEHFGVTCGNPDGCPVEAQATAADLDQAIRLWNGTRAAETPQTETRSAA